MNCEALRLGPAVEGYLPCAIRLRAPENVNQVPTHFILLCDVSESMNDDHKLDNIKRCAELVVGLLNAQDSMSLITFGDTAKLHFKHMAATDTNKAVMCSILRGLHCDGCTNLSAGLGFVREVCEESPQKTGLLLLTDGHANRGVHDPNGLCRIVQSLRSDFETLSMHCVAYGTNHNAELLRSIAEDAQGSYAIVNSVEDAATAFGDTLGGLMSCAVQNTTVCIPSGSRVHGPQKIRTDESGCFVDLGDVYAGTTPLILVDIPEAAAGGAECISVKGMLLPELQMWRVCPILVEAEGRQIDIELVKLRYVCADLLTDIMKWRGMTNVERVELEARLAAFLAKLDDDAYAGNPVADILRRERIVLQDTLERAQRGCLHIDDNVIVNQHIASIGLGRGFSTPRAPRAGRRGGVRGWSAASDPDDVESPTGFQNAVQTHISQMLRAASQPVDVDVTGVADVTSHDNR
jgi:hypothetical protein